METTKTGTRTASAVISSRSSRPQGSSGLSEIQRRSLLVTPPRRPINRSELDQTEKETEEFESGHDNPANSAEKSSVPLVRFSDESEGEDYSFYSDDSMDQETSQSLIPHSQTRVSDSSIAESSQSIIPHSEEQGLRLTEVNPKKGDVVEIHMRKGRDGRLHTSRGRVMQVDPDHPNRVKTNTCSKKFRMIKF